MANRKKYTPHRSRTMFVVRGMLVLAVLSTVALAGIVLQQRERIAELQRVDDVPVGPVDHIAANFELIGTLTDSQWNVTFNHKCRGEVKYAVPAQGGSRAGESLVPYCVGTNTLSVVDSNATEEEIIINSQKSTGANDAPMLSSIDRVQKKKTLLVTYDVIPCTFSGDECGIGAGYVGANIAYDTTNQSSRALLSFPSIGTPIWNATGTKALFPVVQVGGAGCDNRPIVGYDFENDVASDVTEETACEFAGRTSTDVVGTSLPEWGPVYWTSDDAFAAVLLNADGSVEQIEKTF